MWRFYIELFRDDCYGDYVEAPETSDGLPVCSDLNTARFFYSPDELDSWVKAYTTLSKEDCEYGIKGVYFKEKMENKG